MLVTALRARYPQVDGWNPITRSTGVMEIEVVHRALPEAIMGVKQVVPVALVFQLF